MPQFTRFPQCYCPTPSASRNSYLPSASATFVTRTAFSLTDKKQLYPISLPRWFVGSHVDLRGNVKWQKTATAGGDDEILFSDEGFKINRADAKVTLSLRFLHVVIAWKRGNASFESGVGIIWRDWGCCVQLFDQTHQLCRTPFWSCWNLIFIQSRASLTYRLVLNRSMPPCILDIVRSQLLIDALRKNARHVWHLHKKQFSLFTKSYIKSIKNVIYIYIYIWSYIKSIKKVIYIYKLI